MRVSQSMSGGRRAAAKVLFVWTFQADVPEVKSARGVGLIGGVAKTKHTVAARAMPPVFASLHSGTGNVFETQLRVLQHSWS